MVLKHFESFSSVHAKFKESCRTDDWADRLNHLFTAGLLLIFAILVSTAQFVGENRIKCWSPAELKEFHENYINNYCWISNTYYIPMLETIPTDVQHRQEEEITYYQWVPLILAFQAFMFHFPNFIWNLLNVHSGLNLGKIRALADETQCGDILKRDDVVRNLSKVLQRWIQIQRPYKHNVMVRAKATFSHIFCLYCNKREGNFLTGLYLCTKVMYLSNVIGQFFLLSSFLDMDFKTQGVEYVKMMRNGEPMKESSRFPRVTMCDFGSFRHEFESDPTRVFTKNWNGRQYSYKGPTTILIEPDGRTLHSFGYDAEKKYIDLIQDEEQEHWYYFERFKMKLYDQQRLGRDMLIYDITGKKSLPAKTVISLSIQYMKDDLMSVLQQRIFGCGIKADDIHWVLTVPAIWNDAAKQFMREAAHEVGIPADKLSIALEPEAASLYCRHLPIEMISSDKTSLTTFLPGKRYIVLDAGGGTVDITVHEVLHGGKLKELYKASGGHWGGTRVDEAFLDFLVDLVGSDVMSKFKERYTEEYLELLREFEGKKRSILSSSDEKVRLKFPYTFIQLIEDLKRKSLQKVIDDSIYSKQLKLVTDKLRIEASLAKSFFDTSITKTVEHVKKLLKEPVTDGVDAILMVGGFSESNMLHEAVKSNFPDFGVIVPNDAGLAVLKGAVIFGHSPSTISERVSKYTYGVAVLQEFYPFLHPEEKKIIIHGKSYCSDIFSVHVHAGQTLIVGEHQSKEIYETVSHNVHDGLIRIFATLKSDPKFVDEPGSEQIGKLTIPMSGSGIGRKVQVKMIFGGTEIVVECTEIATGKIKNTIVDFLL